MKVYPVRRPEYEVGIKTKKSKLTQSAHEVSVLSRLL